jgi:hypothetical protein
MGNAGEEREDVFRETTGDIQRLIFIGTASKLFWDNNVEKSIITLDIDINSEMNILSHIEPSIFSSSNDRFEQILKASPFWIRLIKLPIPGLKGLKLNTK